MATRTVVIGSGAGGVDGGHGAGRGRLGRRRSSRRAPNYVRRPHRRPRPTPSCSQRRAQEPARLRGPDPDARAAHLPRQRRGRRAPPRRRRQRPAPDRSAAARSTGTPRRPAFWDIDFQKRRLLGPFRGADVTDWPFTYDEIVAGLRRGRAADRRGRRHRPAARRADAGATRPAPGPADAAGPGAVQRRCCYAAAAAAARLRTRSRCRWRSTRSRTTAGRRATTAGSAAATAARSTPASARWPRCAGRCSTGRVELRAETFVAKVDIDGRRATGVTLVDARRHDAHHVPADLVVLGGSAIESIRLALLSGLPEPARPRRPRPDVPLVHRRLRRSSSTERVHAPPRPVAPATASTTSPTPTSPARGRSPQAAGLPYLRGRDPRARRHASCPIGEAQLYTSFLLGPVQPDQAVRHGVQAADAGEPAPRPAGRHPDDRRGPAPAHQHRRPRPQVKDVRGVPVARDHLRARHQHEVAAQHVLHPAARRRSSKAAGADVARRVPDDLTDELPVAGRRACPTTSTSWAACAWAPTRRTSVTDADGRCSAASTTSSWPTASVFPTSRRATTRRSRSWPPRCATPGAGRRRTDGRRDQPTISGGRRQPAGRGTRARDRPDRLHQRGHRQRPRGPGPTGQGGCPPARLLGAHGARSGRRRRGDGSADPRSHRRPERRWPPRCPGGRRRALHRRHARRAAGGPPAGLRRWPVQRPGRCGP